VTLLCADNLTAEDALKNKLDVDDCSRRDGRIPLHTEGEGLATCDADWERELE